MSIVNFKIIHLICAFILFWINHKNLCYASNPTGIFTIGQYTTELKLIHYLPYLEKLGKNSICKYDMVTMKSICAEILNDEYFHKMKLYYHSRTEVLCDEISVVLKKGSPTAMKTLTTIDVDTIKCSTLKESGKGELDLGPFYWVTQAGPEVALVFEATSDKDKILGQSNYVISLAYDEKFQFTVI